MNIINTENNGKSLTNRQIGAQLTKERIYQSAIALIKQKGYTNVSIQDITDAAGVAKGSFYTHFHSKEQILKYSYEHSDQFYFQVYQALPDTDFLSMLYLFIRNSYKALEERGKEMLQAITSNYFIEDLKDVYSNKSRNLYTCLGKIFEKGRACGLLDDSVSDEERVTTVVAALIGAETYWCLSDNDISLSDVASSLIKTLAIGMIEQNKQSI